MIETGMLILVLGVFLIAGTVKGVIGLGLPTITLALITVIIDLRTAMALLIIPSLVTNFWQAFSGSGTKSIFKSIWPFLIFAAVTIFIGTQFIEAVNVIFLSILLGLLLTFYSLSSMGGLRFPKRWANKWWIKILMGTVNGVLTGMTGSFVVPGVLYLQAVGLKKDHLIKAMGMLFLISTLVLALALQNLNLITPENWRVSAMGVVPAIAGVFLGQKIRSRLSESRFRSIFFGALLVLGAYIVVSNLLAK